MTNPKINKKKKKMKKLVFFSLLAATLLVAAEGRAQSLSDLLNKENIEKVVNTVTGKNTASLTGTWSFTGSAVEFESDNLLNKAGGTVAANMVEGKLDEYLGKVGITAGKMSFTFNDDNSFSATVGSKKLPGTYTYDSEAGTVNLKFAKLVGINAKVNCTSSELNLLFKSDKLLDLITYLSSKSNNSALQAIGKLGETYDGLMLGLTLKKQ